MLAPTDYKVARTGFLPSVVPILRNDGGSNGMTITLAFRCFGMTEARTEDLRGERCFWDSYYRRNDDNAGGMTEARTEGLR